MWLLSGVAQEAVSNRCLCRSGIPLARGVVGAVWVGSSSHLPVSFQASCIACLWCKQEPSWLREGPELQTEKHFMKFTNLPFTVILLTPRGQPFLSFAVTPNKTAKPFNVEQPLKCFILDHL